MKKKLFILPLVILSATVLSSCSFKFFADEENNECTYYDLGQHSSEGTYFGKTIGTAKTLVVPVVIKGFEANATEANREKIRKAFFGTNEETGWESVSSYYNKSSYGKLNITGEVTYWCETNITYDELGKYGTELGDLGTYKIVEIVYGWLSQSGYHLSDYDVNKDGFIDSLWLIYSCPHQKTTPGFKNDDSPYWAFTFWDYNYINVPKSSLSPVPNTYAWASYDFMDDGVSAGIEIDAHTYIHEHGHVMGLQDYYDYDNKHAPMCAIDMQDWNIGDHNAFSKLAWGWVKPVNVTKETTVELSPTSTSGDCVIIKGNKKKWHGSPFDEYIIIDFLAQDNLWEQDTEHVYSNNLHPYSVPGIRIMHVDARLARIDVKTLKTIEITNTITGGNRYKVARSNTPSYSAYEGEVNPATQKILYQDLLCMIPKNNDLSSTYKSGTKGTNDYLFQTGDSFDLSSYRDFFIDGKLHDGTTIPFKINFIEVSKTKAVLQFVEQ